MDSPSNQLFSCMSCKCHKEQSEIIELQCTHIFCWVCLHNHLKKKSGIKVKCPIQSCSEYLTDREKRQVLNDDDTEIYENKCLDSISNIHRCLLPQCRFIVIYTDPDSQYTCSVCTLYNCVSCKAPHAGYLCSGFQSLSPQDKADCCKAELKKAEKIYEEKRRINTRKETEAIEEISIVYNDGIFICILCCRCIGKHDGVILRNCNHKICKSCLVECIVSSTKIPIICPRCNEQIYEEEIQNVLSHEQLLSYIDTCANVAESKLDSHFRCRTVDCGVLHHTTATTTSFTCVKCKALNCIKCKTVHINETCEQYKVRMSSDRNSLFIEGEIRQGIIWPCIVCETILRKVSGCNWIQCPSCKTELCWIRRMRRWGPKGRGDTSDGCRCGVGGKRCHETCEGCQPHS